MTTTTSPMVEPKRIALVAHDDRKGDLLEWAEYNRDILADHILYAIFRYRAAWRKTWGLSQNPAFRAPA